MTSADRLFQADLFLTCKFLLATGNDSLWDSHLLAVSVQVVGLSVMIVVPIKAAAAETRTVSEPYDLS